MLNPKLIEKWLDALYSGDYKQGQSRLRKGDSYCCLGVLCDVSGRGKWVEDELGCHYKDELGLHTLLLPINLLEPLPGFIITGFGRFTLASLNDHRGYSFKQIADTIIQNLTPKDLKGTKYAKA